MGMSVTDIDKSSKVAAEMAGEGIVRLDAKAVDRAQAAQLYVGRPAIYPKRAQGFFRSLKWRVMAVTLAIYYLVPWIRWDRGPALPSQAVLLDVANGRIFLFGLEIWPQDFYLLTGVLVISALGLFLFTSLFGRVWCGYLCPQTVWTDLMIAVERFWQGDRNERIRLDRLPWSLSAGGTEKIVKKTATHLTWLLIAVATGGAFVFYFGDAPTLLRDFIAGEAPVEAYVFLSLFAATTYVLGGLAREQVCIYMCPWPRIQGALIDRDSLLVTYRETRGEPRGPHKKGTTWEGRGDCIDCNACVAVCPMGIDIRDGAQLECIHCALCIDACNDIMKKVERPANLIGYDTYAGLEAAHHGQPKPATRLIRPRTILYSALIAFVGALMLVALLRRSTLDVALLPDRNPLFVTLSDGSVRNAFTLKILNKRQEPHTFVVSLDGLAGGQLSVAGYEGQSEPHITVPADGGTELRAFVKVPPAALTTLEPGSVKYGIVVRDEADSSQLRHNAVFRRP
jgi:cytochrome c oxidase accessory protein FixG